MTEKNVIPELHDRLIAATALRINTPILTRDPHHQRLHRRDLRLVKGLSLFIFATDNDVAALFAARCAQVLGAFVSLALDQPQAQPLKVAR